MYQAFKALQKAPRVRKDAFTLRRPQLTRRRWECPAFLHTSSTTCAGPVPHVNFGHLAQDFKGALFRHQALLQCITLHTSAAPTASSIVSFPLAQTGEGIKECELTEWYVQVKMHRLKLPPGCQVACFLFDCTASCRQGAVSRSLKRYVRFRVTKQPLKSPADIQESSRSCTTVQVTLSRCDLFEPT